MGVETIRYRSKKQGSKHGVRTVVGTDPTKKRFGDSRYADGLFKDVKDAFLTVGKKVFK